MSGQPALPRWFARAFWSGLALVASVVVTVHSLADSACTLDRATATTIDPKPFLTGGYGTRWNRAVGRIAFMRPDATGHYQLFTMQPDGTDIRALSELRPEPANGHAGSAYWHPSGRYVLFTAQKPDWHGRGLFGVPDYEALPGFGRHDDLWAATPDGAHFWPLLNEPNDRDEGILMPVVSPDGRAVAWSARQPGGKYLLMVADFVETPAPHLANARAYQPGNGGYFEPGSFTSDSRALMYATDQDTHNFWLSQIDRLDLATGQSVRLTRGGDYNEHPTVVATPSGDWVIYMSTREARRRPFHLMLGTDWWVMRADGSGVKRLTTMNINGPGNPEDFGAPQVAGTVSVSPTGQFMLGDVQDSLVKQTGLVRVVRFVCPTR